MRIKSACLLALFFALSGCARAQETPAPAASATAPQAAIAAQPSATASETPPPAPPAAFEGTTTTKVNVRAQPSKESPALGMLDASAKVQIIGRDESGGWYEIRYADASGWVSAQYVQTDSPAAIPFSLSRQPTPAPTIPPPSAALDGDSPQAPLASVLLSPASARALQVNGELSAADAEDWIQFETRSGAAVVRILRAESVLLVELWNRGTRLDSFTLSAGEEKTIAAANAEIYALRISAPNSGELRYIRYAISIKSVQ